MDVSVEELRRIAADLALENVVLRIRLAELQQQQQPAQEETQKPEPAAEPA